MRARNKYSSIGLGVLRATILTIVFLIFYTLITSLSSRGMENSELGIGFLFITVISVLYGAAYAARSAGEKGWFVGMMVGLIYILLIYLVSIISGRESSLELKDIFRILLCIFAGTLSGMLGINL
ncbi:TIGR04086 family membrane protein [Hathewaya massiliensis]|uniref:TIGR04086 family membrane protein n=1 Tax=Hathewaya massiliensis TaxID=1964382 RepID=UPI00115AA960|nr:TIGR04086 family membrane protein [Hathewaya massiliensis]